MPKLPINYKNALIYKICCNDPNITDIYIGSTTNFYQRTRAHKTSCNNPNGKSYNLHVYKFIRDNGGWKNWRMDLIEFYECNNKLSENDFKIICDNFMIDRKITDFFEKVCYCCSYYEYINGSLCVRPNA